MSKKVNVLISIGFIGFFFLTLIERLTSLVMSVNCTDPARAMYSISQGDPIVITYLVIMCAGLFVGFVVFLEPVLQMIIHFFKKENYVFNFKKLTVASMAFLIALMMDTAFYITVMQIIADLFLYFVFIMLTINSKLLNQKIHRIVISAIYLFLYGFSIQPCYFSNNSSTAIPYYVFAFLTVFVVIPFYGSMLYRFFITGETKLNILPVILLVTSSALCLSLNTTNWGNLSWLGFIFIIITLVFYLCVVLPRNIKKKYSNE